LPSDPLTTLELRRNAKPLAQGSNDCDVPDALEKYAEPGIEPGFED
jgi:hypothetical protein